MRSQISLEHIIRGVHTTEPELERPRNEQLAIERTLIQAYEEELRDEKNRKIPRHEQDEDLGRFGVMKPGRDPVAGEREG